ncbi:uncharacterized protein AKAW2_61346S [Aspergillus luchuensis]|uniref:Similar to An12g10370 n=1 Tax=Aspergillus kawachii TaxID=1069201 RepID=A0A146EY51_ASPKA|nr:uncharacterized protein AKAW2_61346S [Aspergillus luchuensis]BCS03082.1 hypothetical protein AKAW2_61346S [Aspergillus luchuensis]BCS14729.1 hypothetical protein ALUC_61285S [Aspergillus luchuensis]GAA87853.1 similar to An12g10370 [Aspergillus luchuensis IFO 4308]GAT18551.1 similar to An12g10370 [Aspergillus luchuensis]
MDDTKVNIKRENFKDSLSKALNNRAASTKFPFAMTPSTSSAAPSVVWSASSSTPQKKRPILSPTFATRDAKRTITTTSTTTKPTIPAHLVADLKVLVEQLESATTPATTAAEADSTIYTEDNLREWGPFEQKSDGWGDIRENVPWVDTALNIIKQGEKVYEKNLKAFQDIADKLMALGDQAQEIRTEMDAVCAKLHCFHEACLDLQIEVGNISSQEVCDITRLSLEALLEAHAGDVEGCATVKKALGKKDDEWNDGW